MRVAKKYGIAPLAEEQLLAWRTARVLHELDTLQARDPLEHLLQCTLFKEIAKVLTEHGYTHEAAVAEEQAAAASPVAKEIPVIVRSALSSMHKRSCKQLGL